MLHYIYQNLDNIYNCANSYDNKLWTGIYKFRSFGKIFFYVTFNKQECFAEDILIIELRFFKFL